MYPSLPNFSGGSAGPAPTRTGAYSAADTGGVAAASRPQHAADSSPWAADSHCVLRVKIADEYRLDPLVQVPPSLEASSRPHRDFDFDYERKVMQQEGSRLVDRFLSKPEEGYYTGTKVGKFISMGYNPACVHLALAYQATTRGDDAQVVDFCNNYTQLLGMGFSPAVAAGALVKAKNDATAATDLCLATSS